jgi:hypothetical protein
LVCAGLPASAQESSSQSQVPPATNPTQPSPAYVTVDPLAGVRYDNKWELSVEMAYAHAKAGPNLLEGANLGGVNVNGSYYLARLWRLEGTFRPYLGTSGAAPNPLDIRGPFIAEYMFAAGPQWLGPHNKHGALSAHILVGGTYGNFEHDLGGYPGATAETVGFYHNQMALATIMGGHIDLNRSAHWTFRMTPDAILTNYGINYGPKTHQLDINAAFSVGVEYKFLPKKKK